MSRASRDMSTTAWRGATLAGAVPEAPITERSAVLGAGAGPLANMEFSRFSC
jgi:hypothetical protein